MAAPPGHERPPRPLPPRHPADRGGQAAAAAAGGGGAPRGRAQGAGGVGGAVLPPQDSAAVQVKMSNLLSYGSVFAVQVYPKQRNVQEEPPITNNNWEKEIEVGS